MISRNLTTVWFPGFARSELIIIHPNCFIKKRSMGTTFPWPIATRTSSTGQLWAVSSSGVAGVGKATSIPSVSMSLLGSRDKPAWPALELWDSNLHKFSEILKGPLHMSVFWKFHNCTPKYDVVSNICVYIYIILSICIYIYICYAPKSHLWNGTWGVFSGVWTNLVMVMVGLPDARRVNKIKNWNGTV